VAGEACGSSSCLGRGCGRKLNIKAAAKLQTAPTQHSKIKMILVLTANPKSKSLIRVQINQMQMKLVVLRIAKWLGIFGLARHLTRGRLRILCYHGFCLADEASFRPKLFIDGPTFERRLGILKGMGCEVLSLQDALQRLDDGIMPALPVVLTMDDGWYSSYSIGVPIAEKFAYPVTIYVTSYYVEKQCPIFRLAVQYMFWKTNRTTIPAGEWDWVGKVAIDLADHKIRDEVMWRSIKFGEARTSQGEREQIARRIGKTLDVTYEALESSRSMSLMTPDEVRAAYDRGVDIQLHTHRHSFLLGDPGSLATEVTDNRESLARMTSRSLTHFCYPSGQWNPSCLPILAGLGVQSATTCEPGFSTRMSLRLALPRFLDGSNICAIEFEAELSGVLELARILRSRLRMAGSQSPA